MKKLWLVTGLIGVLFAPTAKAALDLQINRFNGYYDGSASPQSSGGEFTIYNVTPSLASTLVFGGPASSANPGGLGIQPSFQTFCLEGGENISLGGSYNAVINSAAIKGGNAVSDPISKGTSFLYSQFRSGNLANFNYTVGSGRDVSGGQLQLMIWALEGEEGLTLASQSLNPLYNTLVTQFGANTALWTADAAVAENGVVVLNLYNADGSVAQDQLAIVPEPSTVIAGVLLLLPFGASTIRILRKKSIA